MITNIFNRMLSLTNRVFLKKSVKDQGTYPTLSVSYWGSDDNRVELLNPYGMFGIPPDGSHGVSWSINGIEENQIAILYKADIRPEGLEPGEAAFGNFLNDTFSLWLNSGEINIKSKTGATVVISGEDDEGEGGGKITITDKAGSTLTMAEDAIVTTAAGGGVITMAADGSIVAADSGDSVIAMAADGTIVATAGGGGVITMAADGTIAAKASQFTIDAPSTVLTGNLQVAGAITGAGGLAISGGSGAAITGSMSATGEITGNGVALSTHDHDYDWTDAAGSDTTDPPN